MAYPCYRCKYEFGQIGHLNRHLKRKNPCKLWSESVDSTGQPIIAKSYKVIIQEDIESLKEVIRFLSEEDKEVKILVDQFKVKRLRFPSEDTKIPADQLLKLRPRF